MNYAQWIAIAVPLLGIYLLFVFTAEEKEKTKVDRRSNALSGLFIVPFIILLMPFLGVAMILEALRKRPRDWGALIGGCFILALYAGIAWLVYALRTIPIEDLPVE